MLTKMNNSLYKAIAKGIFWLIEDELVYQSISCDENGNPLGSLLEDAVSKSGSTYNHKLYWATLPKKITRGRSYQYYPRGRVEIAHGAAKIYLNPNIMHEETKEKIIKAFCLFGMPVRMVTDGSPHYECYLDWEKRLRDNEV